MTARAVLYARTSGDDRGKDNLEAQLELCREYAQAKGYQVVTELAEDDRGASGAVLDLPQLSRALDMGQDGEYQVLVARELDRLARGLAKQLVVEKQLLGYGVRVEYARQEYTDTPEGRLQKHVVGAIAEFEREQIILRTHRGRRNRVKRGSVLVAGRPPFGYQATHDGTIFHLQPKDDEAAIVWQIFDWYTSGPMGVAEITHRLGELGILSPADLNPLKAGGKKRGRAEWNRATVHRMLKNPTYTGTWTYGKRNGRTKADNGPDHALTVEVPALIDPETWKAAQERIELNRRNGRRPKKYDYLLAARVRCGTCGAAMTGNPSKSRGRVFLYYRCDGKRQGHACSGKWFKAPDADRAVWEWVRGFLIDPASLEAALTEYRAEGERQAEPILERLAIVDRLQADHQGQLQRLLDLYLAGDFAKDVLTDRKARLEATIAALERERDGLRLQLDRQVVSDDQVQRLMGWASDLAGHVDRASKRFKTRRAIVEALDVRATLAWEEGEAVVYATCILTGSLNIGLFIPTAAHPQQEVRAESHTPSGTSRRTGSTAFRFTIS